MKERVGEMLEGRSDVNDCNIRTFHSFGAWFLRRFGSEIGLDSNFTIYDDNDLAEFARFLFPELQETGNLTHHEKNQLCKRPGTYLYRQLAVSQGRLHLQANV